MVSLLSLQKQLMYYEILLLLSRIISIYAGYYFYSDIFMLRIYRCVIFVPLTGHEPWVAGRPFFIVICCALDILLLVLHFIQYASMPISYLTDRESARWCNECPNMANPDRDTTTSFAVCLQLTGKWKQLPP